MIPALRRIFLFFVYTIAIGWLLLHSSIVQKKVAETFENSVFKATGYHIEVGRISLSFPDTLVMNEILVKDDHLAVLLRTDQATLSIDISEILRGSLTTLNLSLEQATLDSLPGSLLSPGSNTDLQHLELKVSIKDLDIAPTIFKDYGLPEKVDIYSVNLKEIAFYSSGGMLELTGAAFLKSEVNGIPFHVNTDFKVLQDLVFNADFSALINQNLPFSGKLIINPEGEICLSSTNTSFQEMIFEKIELQTSFATRQVQYPFTLSLQGLWGQSPAALDATGSWTNENDAWQGTLSSLTGNAFEQFFKLSEPIAIHKHSNILSISPFSLVIGNATLNGVLSYSEQDIDGSLAIDDFPIELLEQKMGKLLMDGKFSIEASLKGSAKNPQIDIMIAANDLMIEDKMFQKIKPGHGELTLSLENSLLTGRGVMKNPETPPVYLNFQIPMPFSLIPLKFPIDQEVPLSGIIAAEGEIAPILQVLLDNPTTFSGHAAAFINLSGTLLKPELTGHCDISNGSYEIPEIGVSLTALFAKIEMLESKLNITHVEAHDGKGGKITGSGSFLIDHDQSNPFALEMILEEAALLNQDYVQIVCNGPLVLKGNSREGWLSGELEVSRASVTIPERSYSTINTVDVTYINIPENSQKPQWLSEQESSWPLTLDIHLAIPKSLSVKGRDLTSTWKGKIAVQGQTKTPLLFGQLILTEGEYLFNGNPFAINQGTITFAGDLDKKTTLYVIASKDLDKVKVDVIAKGPIKNPELSFRSNPPLPQREILSWLLFNRGTTEISPFQGSQLSESITNLSSNQQGPDILSKIRSTLGIDRFEICRNTKNDNHEVNIQVGKYISDNILISVIKSDVNSLAIEATLTDKIKLQAQVGDDAQGQLLLKWKRDY